jgi:ABC-type dipeptide/oligopeptide/nickel transport system ATPase component
MLSARAPACDTIQGGLTFIYGASGSGRTTIAASLLKIIDVDKVILIQPGIVYQDRSSLCGYIGNSMIETYTQEEFTDATLSNIISEREAELWISEEKNIQAQVTALVFECNYLLYTNKGIFAKMQICEQLGITTIITLHTDKCIPAEAKMMACMEIFSEPRAARSWIGRMSTGLNKDQKANAIACVDDAFGDPTLKFQKLYWDRLEQQWHKHVVTSARICNDE